LLMREVPLYTGFLYARFPVQVMESSDVAPATGRPSRFPSHMRNLARKKPRAEEASSIRNSDDLAHKKQRPPCTGLPRA
jgi:hypothetical protein